MGTASVPCPLTFSPMQLSESSIYIGLKRLRRILYQAQFLMGKADRIVYGTPLMQECANVLRYYILAFDTKSRNTEYMDEAMGWYAVLREDIEFCTEQNMIHYAKRKPKTADPTPDEYINSQKIELFEIVARIDADMCRYRASLIKGKTVVDFEATAD